METKKTLENKLRELASNVLENKIDGEEFDYIMNKLNLDKNQIIEKVIDYTLNVDKLINDDYKNGIMRVVLHLHNLVKGSYHQTRQNLVKDYIGETNPKKVVEIGFGVPSKYVFDRTLKDLETTLIDIDKSAQVFSHELLKYRYNNAADLVTYKSMDMDMQQYPGDFNTYVMLDAIEHTKNPTSYLKMLVENSPKDSNFIFSIPICKIDTLKHAHYIEWQTEDDAKEWLNQGGLYIKNKEIAKPNPKIDYFAQFIEGGYYNLLVNCYKNN